jgi:hypothetical protein
MKITFPLLLPGIMAAALLSLALSFDDYIVTAFNSGTEITFPKYVYAAALRGIPPEANVIGSAVFFFAIGLVLVFQLGGALKRGQAGYHAWREVGEMLDLRRKLVESERKRLVQLSQMVTAEQAMVLLMAVTRLVKEHVDDQKALIAISDGIRRIMTAEGR